MSVSELSDDERQGQFLSSREARALNRRVDKLESRFFTEFKDLLNKFSQENKQFIQSQIEANEQFRQSQIEVFREIEEQLSGLIEATKIETQDLISSFNSRPEEYIHESRKENAQIRNDVMHRSDNIALVVTDVEKNNLESIKEVSTKAVESSSIDNSELNSISQQVDRDHTELENINGLVSEVNNNFEIVKDISNKSDGEHSHCEQLREAELVNRLSLTEISIQQINKRLAEIDKQENIPGNRPANISRNNSRVEIENLEVNNNIDEKVSNTNKDDTISLSQSKSNLRIPPKEWSEELSISALSNTDSKFPNFKPGGELHPMIFFKAFENAFPPKWNDSKRINTPYYSKQWGIFRKYFEWYNYFLSWGIPRSLVGFTYVFVVMQCSPNMYDYIF